MATQAQETAIRERMAEVLLETGALKKATFGGFKVDESKLGAALDAIKADPLLKDEHTAKSVFSKNGDADAKNKDKPLAHEASTVGWDKSSIQAIANSPDMETRADKRAPSWKDQQLAKVKAAVGSVVETAKAQIAPALSAVDNARRETQEARAENQMRVAEGNSHKVPTRNDAAIARAESGKGQVADDSCLGTLPSPSTPRGQGNNRNQECAR